MGTEDDDSETYLGSGIWIANRRFFPFLDVKVEWDNNSKLSWGVYIIPNKAL